MPVGQGEGQFPHPPELCAFLVANAADLGVAFPITPAMLPDLGLQLAPEVAAAFLEVAGGRLSQYGAL